MQSHGLIPDRETIVAVALGICQTLSDNGVKFTNLKESTRAGNRVTFIKLSDIQIEGIDIERIISENELSGDIEIGKMILNLRQAYNKTNKLPMTYEERMQAAAIPRTNRG